MPHDCLAGPSGEIWCRADGEWGKAGLLLTAWSHDRKLLEYIQYYLSMAVQLHAEVCMHVSKFPRVYIVLIMDCA